MRESLRVVSFPDRFLTNQCHFKSQGNKSERIDKLIKILFIANAVYIIYSILREVTFIVYFLREKFEF